MTQEERLATFVTGLEAVGVSRLVMGGHAVAAQQPRQQ